VSVISDRGHDSGRFAVDEHLEEQALLGAFSQRILVLGLSPHPLLGVQLAVLCVNLRYPLSKNSSRAGPNGNHFIRVGSRPSSEVLDQTSDYVEVDRTPLAISRIHLDRLK
jgi:hypothetical protein